MKKLEEYKNTVVGVIPEDWEVKELGNVTNLNMGKTPKRNEKIYWDNGIYSWVSIKDMQNKYISKTKEKVSKKAFEKVFKEKIVSKGTLLMSFKLTVGKVGILNIDAFHNEAIISIHSKKETSRDFLYYYMNGIDYSKYIDNAVKGKTLNKSKLQNLKITLPPLP
ncbi:MAG: restriction endonuclease subunit S, partial [Methanosarcinales archaeon]|nr:restriction endonuclease subunit S [Methanosarcinales archaeon]